MCLKPVPPHPIPETTAALVHDLFPDGSVYQFISDVLFEHFRDEDFADLYAKDGWSSISPVLLALVLSFKPSKMSSYEAHGKQLLATST